MVEKRRSVIWPVLAKTHLKSAFEYIKQHSLQNAIKVRKDILESTRKLSVHPEIHLPDKYKINNDGSFRAYELHRYRIAYQIAENEIIIVHVRHTSRLPQEY